MANLDRTKVTSLDGETKDYKNYTAGPFDDDKSAYLDTEMEGVLIADVREAKLDISEQCVIYEKIAKYHGFEPDYDSMNVHGFITQTLPFYLDDERPYVSSDDLRTIIKAINNKVVDNNFKFRYRDEEIKPKRKEYLKLNRKLNQYGRILVNVIYSEDIRDIKFEVIEPFRYFPIGQNDYEIYTQVEDYYDKSGNRYQSYIREVRHVYGDGYVWYSVKHYYIDDEKHIYLENSFYEYEEEILSDSTNLYEMTTEDDESIIISIRHELLMLTLVNTAEAIELKGSQFTIHADQRYFENGKFITGDIYRLYNIDTIGEKPIFEPVQPELRTKNYIDMKNFYYKSIASDLGINPKILGLVTAVEVTATDIVAEEEKTMETVNSMRENFVANLEDPLEFVYEDIMIIMPQYYNQSMERKAKTVSVINQATSVKQKINYMYPEMTPEEKAEEVALVKLETNKPLLAIDREILKRLGAKLDNGLDTPDKSIV